MKKMFLAAALFVLSLPSFFAEGKSYVIDLNDTTNGKVVTIGKNKYGSNYQNVNPPTFTKFFAGDFPEPGDVIEVRYKFTSNMELPNLTMAVIDNSQAAKYWLPISNQYKTVKDIPAGKVYEGSLEFKVVAKPLAEITVQLMYDDKINSKISLQKAGGKTGRK